MSQPTEESAFRILLLVHSDTTARSLRSLLRETKMDLQLVRTRSMSEAREALAEASSEGNRFGIAILGLDLPDSRGLESIQRLASTKSETPPILVTSTQDEEEMAQKAIRAGAYDYLVLGNVTRLALRRILQHARERHNYERALLDAQQRLQAAEKLEAVGQLAGGVAHDFNNMLSIILCGAEVAETAPSEEIVEHLDEIKDAARRAQRLTRQLLAFARRQVLQTQPLDLNETVYSLTELLRRTMGSAIGLDIDLPGERFIVDADPSQVEQILLNLCVNARDAMPRGGRLQIACRRRAWEYLSPKAKAQLDKDNYLQLRVTDTGNGIPAEILDHVFEPFVTSKAPGEGTGLGLATVYGIVKQSRGHIDLESSPAGTTFYIYLPEYAKAPQSLAEAKRKQPAPQGSETILLVEDEPMLRRLVQRTLEDLGYHVLVALDPHHAIELCYDAEQQIDLLLSDVVMPGMDGRSLVIEARRLRPGLKALLTSGYSAGLAEEGITANFEFLPKPVTRDALAEKIRAVLARRPSPGPRLVRPAS
ncbi:MAG: response regulator [Acidobacteriota bacterium]